MGNPLQGRWDAILNTGQAGIPFRLEITDEGSSLKGTFYNGDDTETTTKAVFNNHLLVLDLGHLSRWSVNWQGRNAGRQNPENNDFSATRHKDVELNLTGVPNIVGS